MKVSFVHIIIFTQTATRTSLLTNATRVQIFSKTDFFRIIQNIVIKVRNVIIVITITIKVKSRNVNKQ